MWILSHNFSKILRWVLGWLYQNNHWKDNEGSKLELPRNWYNHPKTHLKIICQQWNPDIIFLQETKCLFVKLVPLCNVLGFDFVFNVDVEGRSGGLAVFWKTTFVFYVTYEYKYWIHSYLRLPNNVSVLLTNINGPPALQNRDILWNFVFDRLHFSPLASYRRIQPSFLSWR